MNGFVCDEHKVSDRVEKLAQSQAKTATEYFNPSCYMRVSSATERHRQRSNQRQ